MNIARACKQKENVEAVKEWLSGKKHWLLILDNADNPNLDISSLFPSRGRGTILITTRNPDLQKYNTAGSYKVDKLDLKEAIDLLLKATVIEDPQDIMSDRLQNELLTSLDVLHLQLSRPGPLFVKDSAGSTVFAIYFPNKKEKFWS